ncbi:hypothetical protein D3C73_1328240 [compost metagenome]
MIFGLQAKTAEIDKIGYYLNLLRNLEMIVSIFSQIVRNGSYAIALVNRKSYHRLISRIFTHQCNIGTM